MLLSEPCQSVWQVFGVPQIYDENLELVDAGGVDLLEVDLNDLGAAPADQSFQFLVVR